MTSLNKSKHEMIQKLEMPTTSSDMIVNVTKYKCCKK